MRSQFLLGFIFLFTPTFFYLYVYLKVKFNLKIEIVRFLNFDIFFFIHSIERNVLLIDNCFKAENRPKLFTSNYFSERALLFFKLVLKVNLYYFYTLVRGSLDIVTVGKVCFSVICTL